MSLGAWDIFLRVLTLVAVLAVLVGLVRWLLDLMGWSRRRPTTPEAHEGRRRASSLSNLDRPDGSGYDRRVR